MVLIAQFLSIIWSTILPFVPFSFGERVYAIHEHLQPLRRPTLNMYSIMGDTAIYLWQYGIHTQGQWLFLSLTIGAVLRNVCVVWHDQYDDEMC